MTKGTLKWVLLLLQDPLKKDENGDKECLLRMTGNSVALMIEGC